MNRGQRLGKYELIRRLAAGGMAEIFLARVAGSASEKVVVLKRILPRYAEDEDFARMLVDEARLASTLQHPNIVQVYDTGAHPESGHSYFTMEYVRGRDLRQLQRASQLRETPIPLEHAINIVIGVAAGLDYAHDHVGFDGRRMEIVHRDVSPSNVLVAYSGAVKLVDFGIAKAMAHSTVQQGKLKGKIPYMSPEQCRGEPLDRRSDIFSLGTVLWELSTGKRLWKSPRELTTLRRIANEDAPRPSRGVKGYPKDLERVLMRALKRNRDQRYQSAGAFAEDLRAARQRHGFSDANSQLARWMQDTFAEAIAKELEAARGDPDQSVLTLLTQDLEFFAADLLRHDEVATSEFTPTELEAVVDGDDEPTRTPSHVGPRLDPPRGDDEDGN